MSNPGPLRERKKEATRARLLEAAVDLFARDGYHATTVDEIAARADVSRATAFNYFRRKEDFLDAFVQRRRTALAALLDAEEERGVDTATRLRGAFTALVARLEEDPDRNRAMIRAWHEAGGPLLPSAQDTVPLFAMTIKHGQIAGDVRSDLDADQAAAVILDAYVGALTRWSLTTSSSRRTLGEEMDAVMQVILEGIGLRTARKRSR